MNSLCPNLKDSIIYLHYFIEQNTLRITILSNHKLKYGSEDYILPGVISGNVTKSDIKFSGTVWKYIYWIENPVINISNLTVTHIRVRNNIYNDIISKITGLDVPSQLSYSETDKSENKVDKDQNLETHYIYIDFDSFRDESYLNGKYTLNENYRVPYQIKFVNGDNEYPENYVNVRFKEYSMQNMSISKQYIKII